MAVKKVSVRVVSAFYDGASGNKLRSIGEKFQVSASRADLLVSHRVAVIEAGKPPVEDPDETVPDTAEDPDEEPHH
jgi:hypothetical protein